MTKTSMKRKPKSIPTMQNAFEIAPSLEQKVKRLLDETRNPEIPAFADPSVSKEYYVPVKDGAIRILHHIPEQPISGSPVLFVPGWGTAPRAFQDWFEPLYNKVELFFIETREKKSSHMHRWKAQFTMSQKAEDIQQVIAFTGLTDSDFVLVGTCWGASVILQGLIDHSIHAPSVVVVDPMHTLWFSKKVIKYLMPVLPVPLLYLLKPFIKAFKLRNMHEPVQRARVNDFIEDAVFWKWKKAAIQVNDFELYGNLHHIRDTVIVFNGTNDAIHDQRDYPKIAHEIPNSHFMYMKAGEADRERLMGILCRKYAQVGNDEEIPLSLAAFVKF